MNEQPVVLYVEDNPQSCILMRLMLVGRLGLTHVTIWEDSSDFVARMDTLDPKPNVVFLDIHMEPFNGFQMLTMLRENPSYQATPIVALTASVMGEEVHQLRTAGFDGCIAKPINLDTFPDSLRDILTGKEVWTIFS